METNGIIVRQNWGIGLGALLDGELSLAAGKVDFNDAHARIKFIRDKILNRLKTDVGKPGDWISIDGIEWTRGGKS